MLSPLSLCILPLLIHIEHNFNFHRQLFNAMIKTVAILFHIFPKFHFCNLFALFQMKNILNIFNFLIFFVWKIAHLHFLFNQYIMKFHKSNLKSQKIAKTLNLLLALLFSLENFREKFECKNVHNILFQFHSLSTHYFSSWHRFFNSVFWYRLNREILCNFEHSEKRMRLYKKPWCLGVAKVWEKPSWKSCS